VPFTHGGGYSPSFGWDPVPVSYSKIFFVSPYIRHLALLGNNCSCILSYYYFAWDSFVWFFGDPRVRSPKVDRKIRMLTDVKLIKEGKP
jgi:hypothetical protein